MSAQSAIKLLTTKGRNVPGGTTRQPHQTVGFCYKYQITNVLLTPVSSQFLIIAVR